MKLFLAALQFLTIFTVKRDQEISPQGLAASAPFFPLVGALQGVILVISGVLLGDLFPRGVVAALLLVILALTSGGLHLDGFVDTVDGLAGGRSPARRLEIMKKGDVGAIGAAFLVLFLILKFFALYEALGSVGLGAVFLFPVAGRWAMVPMARWATYARKKGLGKAFTGVDSKGLVLATAVAAGLFALFGGLSALVSLALLGALVYAETLFFTSKLGGVTGDVFGFQSETAEVFFLLAAIVL